MLNPISAGPARNDYTGGKTVEVRQRLAVHFICDERAVLHRLPDRNALDKIRRLVYDRSIRSVEYDLNCFLLDADLVEHVFEACALPARAAHGTIAPFDARHVRLKHAAPVAGALVDGNHFDGRHLLEIIKGELGLPVRTFAADCD